MPAATLSQAMAIPHSPAQNYSFRVPSPPRIIVPPPALNANGIPDLHVVQDSDYDFESSGFKNAEFLKTVTFGNFILSNSMLEWKYEQRRMAQQILPFLYLGPVSASRDRDFLQREGITMVLAVRNTMSAHAKLLGTKVAQELGLEGKMIDVAGNQELIAAFPRAIEAINVHLSAVYQRTQMNGAATAASAQGQMPPTPGKVLVFCESGNERSATLVTAYIMAMYSAGLVKAIQIVQAQRFAIAFDDSLRNLLSTYEIILEAKRDVVQADNSLNAFNGTRGCGKLTTDGSSEVAKAAKRSLDDAYDDDMDMDADNPYFDSERFERRRGSAPFQDGSGA
ncbi:serine/threonine/tyrosine-interacting protein, partial [Lecanoromycetidae sp. Uapishka_2]